MSKVGFDSEFFRRCSPQSGGITVSAPHRPNREPRTNLRYAESFFLRCQNPETGHSLWIDFDSLASPNGFRRVQTVKARWFPDRFKSPGEQAWTLQQELPLKWAQAPASHELKQGECVLRRIHSRGSLASKERNFKWDLEWTHGPHRNYEFLGPLPISGHTVRTLDASLKIHGTIELNGKVTRWDSAIGLLGQWATPRLPAEWQWAYCAEFQEEGAPQKTPFEPVIFEALSIRKFQSFLPPLAFFSIYYKGQEYRVRTLTRPLSIRSDAHESKWKFDVTSGPLQFQGTLEADPRDQQSRLWEDTNGGLRPGFENPYASLRLLIYRNGKLESTRVSRRNTLFEFAKSD